MAPKRTIDRRTRLVNRHPKGTRCPEGSDTPEPSWTGIQTRSLRTGPLPFSLEHTLMSGQAFRWRKQGAAFLGIVSGNVLRLEQRRDRVLYVSCPGQVSSQLVKRYLGLDADSAEALHSLPQDPLLSSAFHKFAGMRILRQDPWETLISFIISSNNNIIRIKKCIESLCRTFGEGIEGAPGFYSFPTPKNLAEASLATLRNVCNLGYRHAYVRETARQIARNPHLLFEIAQMPCQRARKEVMKLRGVGPKVADCVLLYSMGKYEAFPVDTWIQRVIEKSYFPGQHVSPSRISSFAREHFGPFAGYAQLYLFQYALTRGA